MTTFLLASLNVAAWLLVIYAITEQIGAIRYRRQAREHLGSIDDATLAAWARLAGKQRLEQAGNRNGNVLASRRNQHQQASEPRRGETIEEALHPAILKVGSDV